MTEVHFLDNWSGVISNNQVPGVPDNFGINILCELDTYLVGVRYYRHSSASSDRISQMQVYKWSAGGLLSTVLTPVDGGAAGWEVARLASPLRIPGGTEIQITGFVGATLHMDYNSAAVPTPPPGYSWVSGHHRMFNPTGSLAFCPNGDNSWFYLIDAIFDDSSVLPVPSTPGDVTGAVDNGLADWFSEADATHRAGDGIPWDTWQTSLATKTVADAIQVITDKLGHGGSGNDLDWIRGLWRLAGDLTDAEIGLLKSLLDRKDQITGASGGGGSAFYGPSGTQVAAGVETLLGANVSPTELGAQLAVLRERLTLSPDLTDTTRWTLVDTASGSGDALVELQADLYRLEVTAPSDPPSGPLVAGVAWHPRAFWLAPRVHGGFLQRQPLADFGVNTVAPGLFMDGLLLAIDPGYAWSVSAYVLDR